MKPFSYEGARTPAQAAAAAARPGARFIAGGTNLLDLMKLQIETPAHLIDINGLGFDTIEPTVTGGLRIGALVRNTDLAADARVYLGVVYEPALADILPAGLELRLDERHDVAVRGGQRHERGEHEPHGDERHVDRDQVEGGRCVRASASSNTTRAPPPRACAPR